MAEAFIVGAVRTAAGRRRGKLAKQHPIDLGAAILDELMERTGADPELIEDVVFGCGAQQAQWAPNRAGVPLSFIRVKTIAIVRVALERVHGNAHDAAVGHHRFLVQDDLSGLFFIGVGDDHQPQGY